MDAAGRLEGGEAMANEWRQRLWRRWPAVVDRARADWASWALLCGVLAIVLKLIVGKPGMIEGTYVLLALVTAGFIVLRRDLLAAWTITALFLIYDVYHLVWQPMIFPLTFLMLLGLLSARTVERRVYAAPDEGLPWLRMPGLWLWGLFIAAAIPAVWHVPIADRVNAEVYYINVLVMPACMWALGVQVVRSVAQLRRLLVLIAAVGTFVAIHSIIQATTGVFLFQTTENAAILASVNDWILEGTAHTIRASSFLINPDSTGAYLAFMFFLPLGLALHSTSRRWRAVYFVEAALILIALLFTYTTGAWVACVVGVVVFLALAARGRIRLYIFGGIAVAAVALAVVFPSEVRKLLAHATGPNELSLRVGVWETALRVLRAHPLTGIGFEIGTSYSQISEPYRVAQQVIPVSHPHNIFLEIAVFAGIPVALIFIALLVRMMWPVVRNYQRGDWRQRALYAGLLAAFAATFAHGLADRTWTLPALAVILWLVTGAASSPALTEAIAADRLLAELAPPAQPVPMLPVVVGVTVDERGVGAGEAGADATSSHMSAVSTRDWMVDRKTQFGSSMRDSGRGDSGGERRRWRPIAVAVTTALLLTVVGVRLVGVPLTAEAAPCGNSPRQSASTPTTAAAQGNNPITAENALPGTKSWMIPDGHAASVEIQGYAGSVSARAGQPLTFYVSTQVADTPYRVDVYRLGWYGGLGGRLMTTFHERGQAQGYYDWAHVRLVSCTTCTFDATTHMVEANWRPSFTLTVGDDWTSGLYVAKLTDAHDMQAYVSFEALGDSHSTYVAVIADTTSAAYNDWGGYSLYHGPDNALASRATTVSFNRPVLGWRFGNGNGLSYEIDAIRWMERGGYDVSYISSVDLDENPGQLCNHRAYLSLGHDEYWSQAVRDAVERARDSGIGLAFLGANAGFWRVRYEPDSQGRADRHVTCYKDLQRDPLYGKDNSRVTGLFRDPPISRPENALVGIMYIGFITPPAGFAWHYSPSDGSTLLSAGTGLTSGTDYGCNIVGYEFDRVFDNGVAPPDLHILATSNIHVDDGHAETSNSTYYIAPSGALVFASGSIYWSYALDALHIWDVPVTYPSETCLAASQGHAIPGIQHLMANVMAALVEHHDGSEWT